jgi:hypothetical protein
MFFGGMGQKPVPFFVSVPTKRVQLKPNNVLNFCKRSNFLKFMLSLKPPQKPDF